VSQKRIVIPNLVLNSTGQIDRLATYLRFYWVETFDTVISNGGELLMTWQIKK